MAFPTAVNSQITDAVTQTNVKVLGDAPAMAMGNLYQATAQALANAAHNATTAQQQGNRAGAGRAHPLRGIARRRHRRQELMMAFPTAVNDQITDAVTQSNVKVLGDAPAQAMSSLYQSDRAGHGQRGAERCHAATGHRRAA